MVDPSRIRHRIVEIYIADAFSTSGKIYIDFHDGNKERWYIIYVVERASLVERCASKTARAPWTCPAA